MHRIRRPQRLQISSETIRVLRGRELGRVGGANDYQTTVLVTVGRDCPSLHEATATHGEDCKSVTFP